MSSKQRTRLLVLNDPHPMRISKDLAGEIGLNESIVLLQLEYLISISGHERDGKTWTYQSLQGLRDNHFPWWGLTTIGRVLKSLEDQHLIFVGNYNRAGYDRTRWYALNPDGINKLHSIAICQNGKCISQNEQSIYQNGDMQHALLANGSRQNGLPIPETTAETTTERDDASRTTLHTPPALRKQETAPHPEAEGEQPTQPAAGTPPPPVAPPPPAPRRAPNLGPVATSLAQVCRIDPSVAGKGVMGALHKAAGTLHTAGHTAEQIAAFGEWWRRNDWRGKRGDAPTPTQVCDTWGAFTAGTMPRLIAPPPENETEAERIERLRKQIQAEHDARRGRRIINA